MLLLMPYEACQLPHIRTPVSAAQTQSESHFINTKLNSHTLELISCIITVLIREKTIPDLTTGVEMPYNLLPLLTIN